MTIEDQLIALHPMLNKLFEFALLSLKDGNPIRKANSIEVRSYNSIKTNPINLILKLLDHVSVIKRNIS